MLVSGQCSASSKLQLLWQTVESEISFASLCKMPQKKKIKPETQLLLAEEIQEAADFGKETHK